MPKKYHSLEEAAQFVGVSKDELMKLKDSGDIRGFADRGTWKFREDDLEELKRSRNFDSNPSVPILTDDDLDTEEDRSVLASEEDSVGEMPTVIRGENPIMADHKSDSDVRLIPDDDLTTDGGPGDVSVTDDSDSDVQLYDSSPSLVSDDDSDSDVGLMGGTDSDLRLIDDDSDSDVQLIDAESSDEASLVGSEDKTDSDVRLIDDNDFDLMLDDGQSDSSGSDSAPFKSDVFEPEEMSDSFESSVFEDEEESGITLGDGSSIKLASESGISLESLDSGIDTDRPDSDLASGSLMNDDDDDSGLTLDVDDSGIALEGWDDSGITLESDDDDAFVLGDDDDSSFAGPADSGIALESLEDSGIGLASGSVDMGRTVPMMDAQDDIDHDDTAMEVPVLGGESEYELATTGSDDNVLMFDDESDFNEDEATVVRKNPSSEEFDLTGGDDFDMADDFDDDFGSEDELATAVDEDEDELATADMGFEEADDLDAFGDDEYDEFDSEYDEGESHADFTPGAAAGGQQVVVAAPEAEWGGASFAGLAISTLLMTVCAMMMFDLVRSMWSWQDPSGFNSTLLGIVKDMIK